jgi:predicted double-glycine peptidase
MRSTYHIGRILALALFAALMGGCASSAPASAPVAGILPGGGAIYPRMTTLRDQRYRHIVRQGYDWSCGAAALATLLNNAYGQDLSEVQVIQGMYAVGDASEITERGFSMEDMKNYVDELGMTGKGYKLKKHDTIYHVRVPVIVLLDINNFYHFVVMRRAVRGEGIYLADPALGNRKISSTKFFQEWQQDAIFAVIPSPTGKYESDNPLIQVGQEPLGPKQMASNLMPVFNPMTQQMLSAVRVATGPVL